jgi:hypothetical protein
VYTAKAQTLDKGYTVLIRHSKAGYAYQLANRPEATEDLPDAYLVRLAVPAGTREGTLELVEQTPSRRSISIWDKPALALLERLYIATDLLPDAKAKLQPIIDKRREIATLDSGMLQFGSFFFRRPTRPDSDVFSSRSPAGTSLPPPAGRCPISCSSGPKEPMVTRWI